MSYKWDGHDCDMMLGRTERPTSDYVRQLTMCDIGLWSNSLATQLITDNSELKYTGVSIIMDNTVCFIRSNPRFIL